MRGDKFLVLWFWFWLIILVFGSVLNLIVLFWIGRILSLVWFAVIIWFALNYAERFEVDFHV